MAQAFDDRTLMRNVITYDLARDMGYWAPRTKFCELILNDFLFWNYKGIYVMMEKIKRDNNRVDIAKRQMMSAKPMAPVLRRMAEVLHAGHTVWLIGGLNYVTPGRRPLFVRPGFDGPDGWVGDGYYTAWSEQASFLVQTYAKALMPIPVPCDQPVVRYEDVSLTAIRGWRSGAGRLEVLKVSAHRLSDPINPSLP